jgi:hypothetical protein
MSTARFKAELIEGHKGVTAVMVPFDPEAVWKQKPVRFDARREGWLIKGKVNGRAFDGYIGYRWRRYFIMIEPALRKEAKVAIGDTLTVSVAPTLSLQTLARARALSKITTAPKKGRPDAIVLDPPASR